jgi:hypothetical protein
MSSIRLVVQPEFLQHAIPEIWSIQHLDTKVTSLISKKAPPSSVVDGSIHLAYEMGELVSHQLSHFV